MSVSPQSSPSIKTETTDIPYLQAYRIFDRFLSINHCLDNGIFSFLQKETLTAWNLKNAGCYKNTVKRLLYFSGAGKPLLSPRKVVALPEGDYQISFDYYNFATPI